MQSPASGAGIAKGETFMLLALGLFIATYALLLFFPKIRAYIALASAGLFILLGIIPNSDVLSAVNWNVLMMIAGTMGTVFLFIESKMPARLADYIIAKMPNVKWTIISLALFAGIISAFVDNVATVLMVAPIALTIAKKLKISPVPSIIAIAISSNLQGAATLVGDTTSILLGAYAKLNFLDFFFHMGRPGMFWVVQAGAVVSALILLVVFRKEKEPISLDEKTVVEDYFPSYLLLGTVLMLIVASFLPDKDSAIRAAQANGTAVGFYKPETINGLICMGFMLIGILREMFRSKDWKSAFKVIKEIDYFTLLLLGGLFIVIKGIEKAGVVDEISRLFGSISNNNLFVMYTLIVWTSVVLSAFIDNIPYVMTMLPVAEKIAQGMGNDPKVRLLLFFGLLAGATLGGNLTPIGASANITALGILRKEGYEASNKEFMKISVPFTLAAVVTGYILVWVIWR
jgi:Na+/H+ antiporter NhaD/arsenite permease-like protein